MHDLLPILCLWLMTCPWAFMFTPSGACGCCPCDFFTDTFNRADSSSLGSDWTAVAGTSSISSNALQCSTSNCLVVCNTGHPAGQPNINVAVTVTINTSGDTARIVLNYQDASNFWYAEVKAGTGAYLRIYQRSGGTDTQKTTVSFTRATGTFDFCAGIFSSARIVAAVGTTSVVTTGTFSNIQCGLGTGTITGNVRFTPFTASVTSSTCPGCKVTCSGCLNTTAPPAMKFVVTGIVNGAVCPGFGGNCNNRNGTFFLVNGAFCYTGNPASCVWGFNYQPASSTAACSPYWICASRDGTATGGLAYFWDGGNIPVLEFALPSTDCANWNNSTCPKVADNQGSFFCNYANAAATITSLF